MLRLWRVNAAALAMQLEQAAEGDEVEFLAVTLPTCDVAVVGGLGGTFRRRKRHEAVSGPGALAYAYWRVRVSDLFVAVPRGFGTKERRNLEAAILEREGGEQVLEVLYKGRPINAPGARGVSVEPVEALDEALLRRISELPDLTRCAKLGEPTSHPIGLLGSRPMVTIGRELQVIRPYQRPCGVYFFIGDGNA